MAAKSASRLSSSAVSGFAPPHDMSSPATINPAEKKSLQPAAPRLPFLPALPKLPTVSTPKSPTDSFGRPMRNLRLSVTDRCNLRCQYCMPEAEYVWLPREDLLTFEEMGRLVDVFTESRRRKAATHRRRAAAQKRPPRARESIDPKCPHQRLGHHDQWRTASRTGSCAFRGRTQPCDGQSGHPPPFAFPGHEQPRLSRRSSNGNPAPPRMRDSRF